MITRNILCAYGAFLLVFTVICFTVIGTSLAGGQEITTSPIFAVKQGEIIVLRLNEQQCEKELAIFGRSYRCDPDGRLVIGADFQEKTGTYRLLGTNIFIDVMPGDFPDPVYRRRRGRGRKIDEEKRQVERNLMWKAFTTGPVKYPNYPAQIEFRMPLKKNEVTDKFALERRYYRRSRKNYWISTHRGVDLRAKPTGKIPIYTVSPGVVMLAHHFTEGGEGKMLVIYHGSNIYSLYLHLDRFEVAPGQTVNAGQIVAYAGKTGTSAPHLHFAMKVNTKTVSPLEFIERFNALLTPRR